MSSSTSILLELTILDEQDAQTVDWQELEHFQWTQEPKAVLAAKRKHARVSPSQILTGRPISKTGNTAELFSSTAEELASYGANLLH
ncbi:hypothetical protein F5877DRAFT_82157 [Lentinula edodes]|nr:hypothetical protein F5877DRAFT_82157 [Lentinula edodes]